MISIVFPRTGKSSYLTAMLLGLGIIKWFVGVIKLENLRLLIFWETADTITSTLSWNVKMQLRRRSDFKLKLKGQCGVNLDLIKFGQKQGLWLRRNFVRSPSNPLKVSFHLKELLGNEMFYSRGGILNQVWNYIRENRLTDPLDKNLIEPDLKLSKVLGKRCLKINRSQIIAAINKSFTKWNWNEPSDLFYEFILSNFIVLSLLPHFYLLIKSCMLIFNTFLIDV